MIDAGKDPAAEKRDAKQKARAAKNIGWLVDDYKEKVLKHLSGSTNRSYKRQLVRIEDEWRSRPVEEITHTDVIELISKTKSGYKTLKSGWRETETLYIVIREIFKHAAGQRIVVINPGVGISLEAIIGKRPKAKARLMLTDDEIAEFMQAKMNRQNQLSVWIIAATCVRVSEFTNAQRQHIKTDELTVKRLGAGLWHVPESKTGAAMDIPLAPQVVGWFRELDSLALDSRYIVPARSVARLKKHGGDAPIQKDGVWGAINYWIQNYQPKVRRFTPHDLRSTAKSHMRALGVGRDISEMCLNHKLKSVEGIYDQYSYWKERAEALALWADHLVKCQASTAARSARRGMLTRGCASSGRRPYTGPSPSCWRCVCAAVSCRSPDPWTTWNGSSRTSIRSSPTRPGHATTSRLAHGHWRCTGWPVNSSLAGYPGGGGRPIPSTSCRMPGWIRSWPGRGPGRC